MGKRMGLFLFMMSTCLLSADAFAFAIGMEGKDSEPTIQVRSVIEVDGTSGEITLGDIMVPRGISFDQMKEIASVRLADTPQPGETRSFTALGIEQIFKAHIRSLEDKIGTEVSLRIPPRVTIVRKSLQLKPAAVEAEIKAQMKSLCGDCEFEITKLNLPAAPPSVTKGSEWKLRIRPEIPKGSFSYPLEVTLEDGSRRTYWISGMMTAKRLVPVAARQILSGEKIRHEDFQLQWKEVTFATDVPPAKTEMETSLAARQIAAGEIIWRNHLRREQLVKFGDLVKVTTGSDAWQITIDGVSQGSGYIGDKIKVKIPRTQKVLSGLLKEKGVVEIQ